MMVTVARDVELDTLTVEQEDQVLTDWCAGFLPNRRLVLVTTSLACNAGSVRK